MRHPIWDNSTCNNSRGNIIANIITNSSLCIINNGHSTRLNLANHTTSAIDLTIASANIANSIDWEVLDNNVGSDHLPISIKLHISGNSTPDKRKKINIKS